MDRPATSGAEDRGVVARVKGSYPLRLVRAYGESHAGNYAAGLAFNAFMSMFPLILGLLAIIGLVISDPGHRSQLESAVLGFFPDDSRGALQRTLDGVQQHPGLFGVIGIVGLIWSGSSLFASMEFALGEMLGARQRGFLRQRLMAVSMTVIFVVAVVGSVVLNSVVALMGGLPLVGPVVGAAVWIAFMLTIYRFVPNRTFRLTQIWRGALLAGVLMEVLSLVWPLYTGLSHGFNTYGATFALFFLLASWLYFLSQFILLGAVANRMHEGRPDEGGLVPDPAQGDVETDGTRAADRAAVDGEDDRRLLHVRGTADTRSDHVHAESAVHAPTRPDR